MKPVITKNFSLYQADLNIVKNLARQIQKTQRVGSQADSIAIRTIIQEWHEAQKVKNAAVSPCAELEAGR